MFWNDLFKLCAKPGQKTMNYWIFIVIVSKLTDIFGFSYFNCGMVWFGLFKIVEDKCFGGNIDSFVGLQC